MRLFIPTTWVLLLAAIGMMINLDWSWGQNWVLFGLIAWAASFVVGAAYLGPEGGRIAQIIEREGPESPEAQARIRRILLISRCELVVLIAVIVNMVVKPVGNAGWFWGLLAAMVIGIAAVIVVSGRGEEQVAAPATE
jgi:peptidoglycan/LPS O-acetylase OafA/YrhL